MRVLFETIRQAFNLSGKIIKADRLTEGSIHETYRIGLDTGKIYIFQKIHTGVFQNPDAVMQNIIIITEYLQKYYPDMQTLHFYQTDSRMYFYQNWRVMDCIQGQSYKIFHDLHQIQKAGTMFGKFQNAVSGIDPNLLKPVISGFHDTRNYFDQLLNLHSDLPEAQILIKWQEQACEVFDYYQKNKNLFKITHNDMKCSNLLFDSSGNPVAVIDLDTVMNGIPVYDFGDAVRSFASNTNSSESDLSRVGLNLDKFRAFASGWLSQTEYSSEERKLLIPAVFSVTAELAVRYLTDYLQGNLYFKTHDPEQNLIRARNQIRLAQEILNHQSEMEKIL